MSNDEKSTAVALSVPIAVQTRAMAVSLEQTEAMLPAIQAMWPADCKANPALGRMIAKVSIAYGLDPLMGEVILYQGKPYVTIDGRLRKAQEHEQYAGLECRPATDAERAAFRCAETDHLWRAEVYRRDWRKPVVGWGRVTVNDHNAIARGQHAQAIAEKRAKARALRDAFSIPLPSAEDAEDYSPAPSRYVDSTTGEITDTRPGGMLANQGQIAAIHLLCKQLLTDEARAEHLQEMFSKDHTNELTEGEASAFLEYLGKLAGDLESQKPEVIEAKRRDETPLAVPKAASKRFHTRQEPTDVVMPTGRVFISAEQIEADRDEEATETPDEPADKTESTEPESDVEAQSEAAVVLLARINGIALPKAWNRDGALKALGNRLLEAEFDTDQIKAALCALHLAVADEALRLDMAKSNAANRVVAGLATLRDDELPTVKAMAEDWLAKAADHG